MAEKQFKESQIHTLIKALSPKREANGPKKGRRAISRSISPEALSYITTYLNSHLRAVVEACEQSLVEINNNPNSYYNQRRVDLKVAKRAIEIIEEIYEE